MRISDILPQIKLSQRRGGVEKKNIKFGIGNLPLSLLFFLAAFFNCSGLENFEKQKILIEGSGGQHIITAELARTDAQRSQGLMYRKILKDGEGMFFVFERDQSLSFWMKNTLVPLSIAYISSDGRIFEIYDLEPGDLKPVMSSRSGRYALEVPQGWFSRVGIGVGDKVDISGI